MSRTRVRLLIAVLAAAAGAWFLLDERRQDTPDVATGPRHEGASSEAPPSLRGAPVPSIPESSDEGAVDRAPPDASEDEGLKLPWLPPIDVTVCDAETGRVMDVECDLDIEVGQGSFGVVVLVDAPPGYVAWDEVGWWTRGNDLVGRRLAAVVPLRREAVVWVEVRRADGRRPRAAELQWRLQRGAAPVLALDAEAIRVPGVPFFREGRLHFEAKDGTAVAEATASLPASWNTPLEVELVLRESDEPVILDSEVSDHVETDNDLAYEEDLGEPPPRTASLALSVQRRDGSPAANVPVRLGGGTRRTDERGRVRFDKLEEGEVVLSVLTPGFVPLWRRLFLKEGEEAVLDLHEPEGASLEVEVVDGDGRGRPYATVRVLQASRVTWLDLDDGVQRIDHFTDVHGRRRLEHVEPGEVRVTARWGGLWTYVLLEVHEGETSPVRLVLR